MVDAINEVLKELQEYFPSVRIVQWGGVDYNSYISCQDTIKMAVGDLNMGFVQKPVYVPKAVQKPNFGHIRM